MQNSIINRNIRSNQLANNNNYNNNNHSHNNYNNQYKLTNNKQIPLISLQQLEIPLLPSLPHMKPPQKQKNIINNYLHHMQLLLIQLLNSKCLFHSNNDQSKQQKQNNKNNMISQNLIQKMGYYCNNIILNMNQLLTKINHTFQEVLSQQIQAWNTAEQYKSQYFILSEEYAKSSNYLKQFIEDRNKQNIYINDIQIQNKKYKAELSACNQIINQMNTQIEVLEFKYINKQQQNARITQILQQFTVQWENIVEQNQICRQLLSKVLNQNVNYSKQLVTIEELLTNRQNQIRKWKNRCFQELDHNTQSKVLNKKTGINRIK